ncbi:tyrosine--tRNA ligase MSY1 [Aspergillus lucknowensis]|uniref:Tyrosine--tRNA ligase n=1 Tax=Aspergillus lucknowensis TaxID=176173 RepID=A0ABR4M0F5_9EURO
MRPRPLSLPAVARLRARPTVCRLPRPIYGAREYARAADFVDTNRTRTNYCRPTFANATPGVSEGQKRGITQGYLRRMEGAKREWAEFAEEIKAGKRKSFAQHLEERGLLHNVVGDRELLHRIFTEKRVGLYAGVDPTAPSLHVGHMLPFMVLAWAYVWGLPVTFLLGGSTSRIGDPTGRLKGREQAHSSIRKANMASMHMQMKKLGASIEKYGERHGYKRTMVWKRALTNNNTWWNKLPFLEVLRDLGAYMRLGPMLGRDTVKTRLTKGDGMSFAEFSYPLLQAWDWWVLFRKGCQVQVGGGDQYGNILFGVDAVKVISRNTAIEEQRNPLDDDLDKPIGITTPLLTTASGEKFGKSAGNAIWLDKDMTSTFELYQFFVRTPDDVVESYLKMFTFIPLPEISKIMEEQNQDPSKRVAQHALASEFVELIHGKAEADAVALQHRQLFRPRSSTAEPTPLPRNPSSASSHPKSPMSGFINPQSGNPYAPQTNFANMPSVQVTLPASLVFNQTFHKILWSAGLVSSKSEGHRIIANKGAYVGSRPGISGQMQGGSMPDAMSFTPIKTWTADKTQEFIINNDLLFLKLGRWKFKIVNIVSDERFKELGLTAPGWDPETVGPESETTQPKEQSA